MFKIIAFTISVALFIISLVIKIDHIEAIAKQIDKVINFRPRWPFKSKEKANPDECQFEAKYDGATTESWKEQFKSNGWRIKE